MDYYRACVALSKHRHEHGFLPGKRVICRFRDEAPKSGVIVNYGRHWLSVTEDCVPVLLDSGVYQPWKMSDLTLA